MMIEFLPAGIPPEIDIEGFYEPHDAPEDLQPAHRFHQALDNLVEQSRGERGDIGEIIKVTTFRGYNIAVAVFDLANRQQIGFGLALREPEMGQFMTSISISTHYQRRGYGFLTLRYLYLQLASYTLPGIYFGEVNTATTPGHYKAVNKLMARVGGTKITEGQDEEGICSVWSVFVPNPGKNIPLTVTGSDLCFQYPSKKEINRPNLGGEIIQRGRLFFYRDLQIAKVENSRSIIISTPKKNPNFWPGVSLLWQRALAGGMKVDLNFK